MAEQTRAATPAEPTVTLVESEDVLHQDVRTVRLRLRKPEPKKKVQWQSGTVDNEHLNKKKSKCCCQYEKPRAFDESSSSSEEDEECENCHGHVERKKKKKKEPPGSTQASAELAHMRGCNSEERCSLPANIKRSDSEDSIRNSNPQFTKASTSPEVHVQSSKPQVAEEGRNVQGPSV